MNDLLNLGFHGPAFTWSRGRVQARLDRVISNRSWFQKYTNNTIMHLPKVKSDHCPILLRVADRRHVITSQKPFRFLASWLLHEDFSRFVQDNWNNTCSVQKATKVL